jgi:NAD(P)-dependent dehydrogenase (short-subunit alcohol dehydrogenase family)
MMEMSAVTEGRLAGKVVVVTGAARGIGLAIATEAARAGAAVAMLDRDVDVMAETASLRDLKYNVTCQICDVTKPQDWANAVAAVETALGPVTGLVNNAGVNIKHEPLAMPEAEWDRCLDINLKAAWLGSKAVLAGFVERQGGVIVNIASTHAHKIIRHSFPYPVAKHGLIGLTKALAIEYAPFGIRINAISPGYVDTRMVREGHDAAQDPPAARRATEALIPSGRIADPKEIAMVAILLLSDEARSIVASTIIIDGGRSQVYHD